MQKRSLLAFFSLLALLVGLVIIPAAAQDEEAAPAPALVYDTPDGYEATTSLSSDNVSLQKGDDVIMIYGPASYAKILGSETFDDNVAELSFFADRTGFQVGNALDSTFDGPLAGVRVSLSRRNQQGYAYVFEVNGGLHIAVVSLHTGRGQVGAPVDDLAVVVGSIAFPMDVVDVANYSGNFSILISAIQAAGLEETLRGDGPFTLFAPTDDAFNELMTATGMTSDQLLASPLLKDILLYHVVSGSMDTTAVASYVDVTSIPTLLELNNIFIFTGSSGNLHINNANVQITKTDLSATNGVVHVIDKVLLPQAAVDALFGDNQAAANQ